MLFKFMNKMGPQLDAHRILDRLFYHDSGQKLVAAVFGIALAFMFQRVCKGEHCIVVKSPPLDDVDKYIYRVDKECYRYTPRVTECVVKK